MKHFSYLSKLKAPIKLYWWRMNEGRPGEPGNFGDEITKLIIEEAFHRRVMWSEFENCQIIGAGSIIEEVTAHKGTNKPYLWGSGFIESGDLTISPNDYKILAVRGKESLKRIKNTPSAIALGDPGLLASLAVKGPEKKYRLGIVPHYIDIEHPFIKKMMTRPDVRVIDATWPCKTVLQEIAACDTILSSSMHGLIVADSFAVPNLHLKLSDKLKGGSYKFNDYYSVFSAPRYQQVAPATLDPLSPEEIKAYILDCFVAVPSEELAAIKRQLVDCFPF